MASDDATSGSVIAFTERISPRSNGSSSGRHFIGSEGLQGINTQLFQLGSTIPANTTQGYHWNSAANCATVGELDHEAFTNGHLERNSTMSVSSNGTSAAFRFSSRTPRSS